MNTRPVKTKLMIAARKFVKRLLRPFLHWARRHPRLWELLCRLRVRLLPRNLRSRQDLVACLIAQKKWQRAESICRQIVALTPHDSAGYSLLGAVFTEQDRLPEAAETLQSAVDVQRQRPNRDSAAILQHRLVILGLRLLKSGRIAAAEGQWKQALSLGNPLDIYPVLWLEAFVAGHIDLAFELYRQNRRAQSQLQGESLQRGKITRYLRKTWSCQIGHLAHLDGYLKVGMLQWRPPQETVLLSLLESISNCFFLDLWKPYLQVVTDSDQIGALQEEAKITEDFLAIQDVQGSPLWAPIAAAKAQQQWDLEKRSPLLKLDADTIARGRKVLARLGVPLDAWFVGLHARESGYHGKGDNSLQSFRNADVHSYIPAMRAVVERGGWIIRMGDRSMTPLPPMPGVIDYAHSSIKSDWMDIFLCACSRFFIGTQSGLSQVPDCFGVPTVMTNWVSLANPPWYQGGLFIPKMFSLTTTARQLSFHEVLEAGLSFMHTPQFAKKGVTWIDNSPQEILKVVEEMMDRLDHAPSNDDVQLQERWRRLAERHGVIINSRMGSSFLRRHQDLLPASDDPSNASQCAPAA
jgi:putative glycosyltransferase (TIGR04372 family)